MQVIEILKGNYFTETEESMEEYSGRIFSESYRKAMEIYVSLNDN